MFVKDSIQKVLAFLVVIAVMASCQPNTGIAPPEEDGRISVEFVWHDSETDVRNAFVAAVKLSGAPADLDHNIGAMKGFAVKKLGVCYIHAVRPEKVDDDGTTTVGHEVLHCLWGRYHPELELM